MATKKAAARSKTPTVDQLVDKALKARWEEAIARYRDARAEETASWDERYEALGEIIDSDPPYYLAGGYKTARAFLQAEVPDQDERTVRVYVRVARYFDPEDEAKYGVTKLEELLNYLEAAGGVPIAPTKINPDRQVVLLKQGKTTRKVPFDKATKEELRVATRAQRSGAKTSPNQPPIVKAVRAALSKAKLNAIAVRVRSKLVDLNGIPPDRLAALGKALTQVKLPPTS